MLPGIRRNRDSWLPDIFNDFFDNSWMERPTYTAPAINVIENEKEYDVELVGNAKEPRATNSKPMLRTVFATRCEDGPLHFHVVTDTEIERSLEPLSLQER